MRRRFSWRIRHAPGRRAFAVEGTGSFGAGLARFLVAHGERVLEVGRLRRERALAAKTDALDARPRRPQRARPDAAGTAACRRRARALRALTAAREGAVTAKRAGLCQLRDLLVTAPSRCASELRSLPRARLLRAAGGGHDLPPGRDPELRGTLLALRASPAACSILTAEERQLEREIETLIEQARAAAARPSPASDRSAAAQILISWSHPGRIPSEAAFARLAGCAPIPASSGQTLRYRLDRGGDRQLNRALHMIIVTRRRAHPPTIAYIDRRTREGKSSREAIRCLKRYLARNLYRLLENPPIAT